MKKFLTILLTVVLAVCSLGLFTGCEGDGEEKVGEVVMPAYVSDTFTQFDNTQISSDFKLGVICLHDENSTYDKNFLEAVDKAKATFNLTDAQVIVKTNIPETSACLEAANQLVAQGCKAIFANSFGHEQFMIDAARANPTVQFYHATGTQSKTVNVANYHTAFASIYEGRYLAGVAAGLKLQEMINDEKIQSKNKDANGNIKLGYVGAFPYAEVISGYTSWYLGVKSVVNNVVMDVQFTFSWYDETKEKTAAETLISRGAAIISQHADSWGAPNACEDAGIPNVSYNGSTISDCPETFIISSKIDWTFYFKWIIAANGGNAKAVDTDFTGTISNGLMVVLTNANGDVIADNTIETLISVRNELIAGTRKVFDCSKFTVNGENLTTCLADVVDNGDYIPETEAIKTENGITYFAESEFRSAPYFSITIDGITQLNANG